MDEHNFQGKTILSNKYLK
uniref:Uncharacterized protein n=1 Tax=Anguilla anguilla TaxID=7936 RepID=A0A0E9RHD3_ANGAN